MNAKTKKIPQENIFIKILKIIGIPVIVALLVGSKEPWWLTMYQNISENETSEFVTEYLNFAQNGKYENIQELYYDYNNCTSCQQDLKNLKTFTGEQIIKTTKNFLDRNNAIKLILQFDSGKQYEPTLFLIKNHFKIKIKEVNP
jgi:N-glycosylase/DNA lyase